MPFTIDPTDRVLIVGRAGSGKSTLARALFYTSRNLVVVDPKHEEELPRATVCYTLAEVRQAFPQRTTRIVFRPNPEDPRSLDLDGVIRRVMHYGRTCLLLHETVDYASATRIVPALRRASKVGRSLGIQLVSLAQRPVGLHNDIVAEASHVFAFDLSLLGDRQKIAGVGGAGFLDRPPGDHAFGYWGERTTAGRVVWCPPLELRADLAPTATDATGGARNGATDIRQSDHGDGSLDRRAVGIQSGAANVPDSRPV
jgi:hypothetical protein